MRTETDRQLFQTKMKGFLYSLLATLWHVSVQGTLVSPDAITWLSNDTCEVRHIVIDKLKKELNCTVVQSLNSICTKNIRVAYQEMPPYVYKSPTGEVTGLLPAILKDVLVETCCLGCNNIVFEQKSEVPMHMIDDVDILIPFENGVSNRDLFGVPYSKLFEFQQVSFIGKREEHQINILAELFTSLGSTWPIFVIAVIMALCAGSIMWIFDTWNNKDEFPRPFLLGTYEGFWWAFVSMTTVGYGDRTPRTVPARLFAVLWIILGITLFNMFTAAITSTLTTRLAFAYDTKITHQKVGVLKDFVAPFSGLAKMHADPAVYDNIAALKEGLRNGEVEVVALEALMGSYYLKEFREIHESMNVIWTATLDSNAIGLISNQQIANQIKSFMQHNTDSKDMIIAHAFRKLKNIERQVGDDSRYSPDPTFTKVDNQFYISIGVTVSITVFCYAVGFLISKYKTTYGKKKNSVA